MRFKVGEQTFRLRFHHTNRSKSHAPFPPKGSQLYKRAVKQLMRHGWTRATTELLIEKQIEKNGELIWMPVYATISQCSWLDNFSKKTGREVALARMWKEFGDAHKDTRPIAALALAAYHSR